MNTNRFIPITILFVLLLSVLGCGIGSAQLTSTPVPTNTPTSMPVTTGHYTGTNPDVSFDVTASGVENFIITVPFGPNANFGDTCTVALSDTLNINTGGSFSYESELNSTTSNSVTGNIIGAIASGDYTISFCMGGGQLSIDIYPPLGKWTASLNGQ